MKKGVVTILAGIMVLAFSGVSFGGSWSLPLGEAITRPIQSGRQQTAASSSPGTEAAMPGCLSSMRTALLPGRESLCKTF
jgi:hypothetical protein